MKTKRAIVVAVKAKILFGPLTENQALTYDTRTRKIALTKVTSFPEDISFFDSFWGSEKIHKKGPNHHSMKLESRKSTFENLKGFLRQ